MPSSGIGQFPLGDPNLRDGRGLQVPSLARILSYYYRAKTGKVEMVATATITSTGWSSIWRAAG
jgi:hypothetical protein